jgi:hypothetical protein
MSKVPYPVYKCTSVAERDSFMTELYNMGFCRSCFVSRELMLQGRMPEELYVRLIPPYRNDRRCMMAQSSQIEDNHVTNSPRQMIAYINRHNMAFKLPDPEENPF